MTVTFSEKFIKRLLIIILIALMAVFLAQITYAKYRKYAQSLVDADIAKWNIKVNNESIKNKTTLTNRITPQYDGDIYTNSGVIAPGTSGYFEINIDATDSDVSFEYEITLEKADGDTISDLVITGYSQEEGVIIPNSDDTITGEIAHNTPSTSIFVYMTWDDATGEMDNSEDTSAATDGYSNANVLVRINMTQKRN